MTRRQTGGAGPRSPAGDPPEGHAVDKGPSAEQHAIPAEVLLDHAGVMMVAISPQEHVTLINRSACEVLECKRSEALGANWFDNFIPPRARDQVRSVFRQIMAGQLEPVEYFENPVVTRSGALRTIAWHNTMIRAESGAIRCSLSSGVDMTDERQRQRELLESHERFRTLFERARDGMLVADAERRRLIAANPAACELLGYELDELLQLSVDDIHPSEALPTISESFDLQLRGQLELATDLPVKRKDGTILYADISSAPLTLDGTPCLLGIFRDISDKKQLNAKLIQAQKLESLGVLAGGVAHDFNNILVSVLGHAELCLRKGAADGPLRAHLEGIVAAATQAASLCQRLLEYAGESPVSFAPVDINALVRETRDLVASSLPADARLELELAEQLDAIFAVQDQVRQILMNLIINASEALAGAGGIICVRTRIEHVRDKLGAQWHQTDELRPGSFVSLEVEDDGCGMTDETHERMFDPFYTTKVDGRGLGLSAVMGIVRLHRGALKVESAPGQGARFEVLLPVAGRSPVVSKAAPRPQRAPLQGGTVLVVDDKSAVRQVTQQMLELAGYQVRLARDGAEAVASCIQRGSAVRLVLLDLKLAHASGVEIARRILEVAPALPILFMSGHTAESVELHSFSTSRVGFLQKPFTIEQLLEKLEQLAP